MCGCVRKWFCTIPGISSRVASMGKISVQDATPYVKKVDGGPWLATVKEKLTHKLLASTACESAGVSSRSRETVLASLQTQCVCGDLI